jgi:hypothetical protein
MIQLEDGSRLTITRNGPNDAVKLDHGSKLFAIGRDDQGRLRVLDGNGGDLGVNSTHWSWILDKTGHWVGEDALNGTQLVAAESTYGVDFNGDGKIGGGDGNTGNGDHGGSTPPPPPPSGDPQVVVKNGNLSLLVDPSTGAAMIQLEDGSRVTITRGGPNDVVKLDRGSKLFAIGRDDQGRLRVMDGNGNDMGANSTHWSWILDNTGHFVGEDAISGTQLANVEAMYGTDLNGDGKVGGTAKPGAAPDYRQIESNGGDALYVDQASGKAYVSVQGHDPLLVTRDGWGDVLQQRGDWGLAAIATDDQGRTRVLDTSPFSDARYAWILDANGHFIGEESFNKDTIGQAEKLFAVDLDKNGVIGNGAAGTTSFA